MRILTLCEFYPRDRSDWKGVFIRDYVNGLKPHTDVQVLCSKPRGESRELSTIEQEGTSITQHVTAARSTGPLKKWWYLRKWEKEAMRIASKMERPDIIHVHNSVIQGRLALRLAMAWKIPFVVSEHTGPFSSIADHVLKRRRAKYVMERANLVLAVSDRTRKEIQNADIAPKNLEVMYNPVDTLIFKAGLQGPHGTLAFVSRMDDFKGALRTVKAFQRLERDDLQLKMVGSGQEYDAVQSYIIDNNLGGRVMMYGTLSKAEIYGVLKRSDMLIFPSKHESFGLVAAEAWATGIPVVIGENCGAAELVETHGEILGEKCVAEDVESIKIAVENVLARGIEEGREKRRMIIEEELSIGAFGRRLWGKMEEIIKQGK